PLDLGGAENIRGKAIPQTRLPEQVLQHVRRGGGGNANGYAPHRVEAFMNAGHGQRLALGAAVADLERVSFGDMLGRYRHACLDRQRLIHFPLGHAGETLDNCCPRDRNTKLTEVPGDDLTLDGLAVDEDAVAVEND